MTDTNLRDKVSKIAKSDTEEAYKMTKKINSPWFKSQALSYIARYSDNKKTMDKAIKESIKVSRLCDDYKIASVRAWVIVALAERGFKKEAKKSLDEVVELAVRIEPVSSRCEALFNLFQASYYIDKSIANKLYERMQSACPIEEHWRAKRAMKHAQEIIADKVKVREYFW